MIRFLLLATLMLLGGFPAAGQTVITNVKSVQVPGTHRVKITYDVAPGSTCTTALQVSLDGDGLVIPSAAISSDSHLGPGISGSNRTIMVDAAQVKGLESIFTKQLRFKVVATQVTAAGGMALIPAGTFQMGDSFGEGRSDERPVHTVNVSAFYMATHETTKGLWDEVRAWALNNGYTDLRTGDGKGANHPVHTVNWWEVVKWCNARSEIEGFNPVYRNSNGTVFKTGTTQPTPNWSASGYRLPTEAEWEKAARGGLSGKRFPWGDTISHSQANYYSWSGYNYDISPTRESHPTCRIGAQSYSSPVGSFAPNGYGLYDMTGNLWEWCWDWWGGNYYGSSPASNPRGPASGTRRVFRGGGWYGYAVNCRVAYRDYYGPGHSSNGLGFRVARSSVP